MCERTRERKRTRACMHEGAFEIEREREGERKGKVVRSHRCPLDLLDTEIK